MSIASACCSRGELLRRAAGGKGRCPPILPLAAARTEEAAFSRGAAGNRPRRPWACSPFTPGLVLAVAPLPFAIADDGTRHPRGGLVGQPGQGVDVTAARDADHGRNPVPGSSAGRDSRCRRCKPPSVGCASAGIGARRRGTKRHQRCTGFRGPCLRASASPRPLRPGRSGASRGLTGFTVSLARSWRAQPIEHHAACASWCELHHRAVKGDDHVVKDGDGAPAVPAGTPPPARVRLGAAQHVPVYLDRDGRGVRVDPGAPGSGTAALHRCREHGHVGGRGVVAQVGVVTFAAAHPRAGQLPVTLVQRAFTTSCQVCGRGGSRRAAWWPGWLPGTTSGGSRGSGRVRRRNRHQSPFCRFAARTPGRGRPQRPAPSPSGGWTTTGGSLRRRTGPHRAGTRPRYPAHR